MFERLRSLLKKTNNDENVTTQGATAPSSASSPLSESDIQKSSPLDLPAETSVSTAEDSVSTEPDAAHPLPTNTEAGAPEADATDETFWVPDESAHDTARCLLQIGLSVIFIRPGEKKPRKLWEEFQRRHATFQEVHDWGDCEAYAIVCGAISGYVDKAGDQFFLTVLDFDVDGFFEKFEALAGDVIGELPLQRTGGGGYHLYFRSPEPIRNEHLAWAPDASKETGRAIAIETRGEGGYAIGPNSRHPSGSYYTLLRGDLAHIPVISSQEALGLLDIACSLDEAPFTKQQLESAAKREAKAKPKSHKESKAQQFPRTQKVLDAFNAAHTIHEQLQKHGYTTVGDRYARPGGKGGNVVILDGERSFHHGSNDPLSDGHSHSAFDVSCYFEHEGDFKAALRAAAEELGIELGQSDEEKRAARRQQIAEQAGANGQLAIEVGNRQLTAVLRDMMEAIAAFNRAGTQLFRGAQGLLEIAVKEDGSAEMKPVMRSRLQVLAASAAFWFCNGSRGIREISPDAELMENFLASPADWRDIPDLDRLAQAPFFDETGELVDKCGYHTPTRTLLCLPDDFNLGDTTPTKENVAAAIALWKWLLAEVAFADKASFGHAMALAILPFVRKLIHGPTPLHLANAPAVSSGKTTAMAICVAPFTKPVITTEKGNDEE